MLGIRVTVPVACFRKGAAREFFETWDIPPPAQAYGFLLSLVGEEDRARHIGARVAPVTVHAEHGSVVLRTLWRIKTGKLPQGTLANARPDYQQLLTSVELVLWLESAGEDRAQGPTLEHRVRRALDPATRGEIRRFGGLSLGESTHLVDEVSIHTPQPERTGTAFLLADKGAHTLPVWVDHVGSSGTRSVTGSLEPGPLLPPDPERMPVIRPPDAPQPAAKRSRAKADK